MKSTGVLNTPFSEFCVLATPCRASLSKHKPHPSHHLRPHRHGDFRGLQGALNQEGGVGEPGDHCSGSRSASPEPVIQTPKRGWGGDLHRPLQGDFRLHTASGLQRKSSRQKGGDSERRQGLPLRRRLVGNGPSVAGPGGAGRVAADCSRPGPGNWFTRG